MPLHPLQGGALVEEACVEIPVRRHGGTGEETQEAEAVGHGDGDEAAVGLGDPAVEGEAGRGLGGEVSIGDDQKFGLRRVAN